MKNKYVERLVREWNQHGKIVVGVDFDSTLFPWHTIDNQEDMDRVLKVLKDCQLVGIYLVVNTCSVPERHEEILNHCKELGLHVEGINSNPIKLPYGNHGKVYANIFIDDRAGLNEALDILEEAMYMQRTYLQSQKHFDEIG